MGMVRLTQKNSKWPKTLKSYFKDRLHTFSKSGPSARKADMKSVFMQIIFSAGGLLFFRETCVRPDRISHTVMAIAPSGNCLGL